MQSGCSQKRTKWERERGILISHGLGETGKRNFRGLNKVGDEGRK